MEEDMQSLCHRGGCKDGGRGRWSNVVTLKGQGERGSNAISNFSSSAVIHLVYHLSMDS